VQLEDGREFNVEWVAGYSEWDVGDKVILTVESGFGFTVYGTRHTYVSVEETVEAVPEPIKKRLGRGMGGKLGEPLTSSAKPAGKAQNRSLS
jgi:hypothetical protein